MQSFSLSSQKKEQSCQQPTFNVKTCNSQG
uniref:Uncharacterized protein n=1 Tax=Rhizophora mucronata TaxID=61149 RepID=A0A2P2QD28_RHIMU